MSGYTGDHLIEQPAIQLMERNRRESSVKKPILQKVGHE